MSDVDIEKLAAETAIKDLAVRYSVAVDDGDLPTVVESFTSDGVFMRGEQEIRGSAALREFFTAATAVYDLARHAVDMHTVDFGDQPGRATGIVHGSAQLVRDNTFHVAAFRYSDEYEYEDGGWRFARRDISYIYFLPAADLIGGIISEDRVRLPAISPASQD